MGMGWCSVFVFLLLKLLLFVGVQLLMSIEMLRVAKRNIRSAYKINGKCQILIF